MKIAIDLDGVIFQIYEPLLKWYKKIMRKEFDLKAVRHNNKLDVSQKKLRIAFSRMISRKLIPGSTEACALLLEKYGADIVTATILPHKHLLKRNKIKNKVVYVKEIKDKPKLGYDIYIDDYDYSDLLAENQKLILFDYLNIYEDTEDPRVIRVQNWEQVKEILL